MASYGLPQLGEPRIGEFVNRQRPEPVHNEINAWQQILNLIYKEALQRNVIDLFLEMLSSLEDTINNNRVQLFPTLLTTPHDQGVRERVRQVDVVNKQAKAFFEHVQEAAASSEGLGRKAGCGLSFVARKIRQHYKDKDHKSNNLTFRLTGEQAIALAKYSHRLMAVLKIEGESGAQKLEISTGESS